jgi:hypothetical protein
MISTVTYCIFLKKIPKQLDQDEIIEVLDQNKAPEWNEAMVNTNIDILKYPMKNLCLILRV